jgi:DNA transposition AAA+ family ATPase
MYEDRIVASDLLFEMSKIIQEKQIAVLTLDTPFLENKNNKHNQTLNQLIDKYRLTKLTEKEKFVFNQLQEELNSLKQKEKPNTDITDAEVLKSYEKINKNLHELSKIQVDEGRRQVFISNKAKDMINLFTQVEIIFLIIMALLIQIIILYKPKKENSKNS